ncbi:hypothetical protein GCM10017688_04530 [Streptomyces ramulosus]
MGMRKRTAVTVTVAVGVAAALIPLLYVVMANSDTRPRKGNYRSTIVSARKGLFEGSFRYSTIERATAGGITSFRVTVEGARAHRPSGGEPSRGSGSAQVGALMGARLSCAGSHITCTANSSERQPVLTPQDSAEWEWTIATPEAGKASVALTLTAYYEDTKEVLAETSPLAQVIEVEKEWSFWGMIGDSWQWFAGVLAVLAGAVPLVEHLERRRRRAAEGEEGAERHAPAG